MDKNRDLLIHDPLTSRELEILRHIAKGSSDREIAGALFLSLNTIKWHNRQIYRKLGVPNRRQAVALASKEGLLKAQPSSSEGTNAARKHNLPAQVTSFVGREKEIREVTQLLEAERLLTLSGPGGVGKTRLALQVAMAFVDGGAFNDGAYFVDLAPLGDPNLVASSIADVLELAENPDEQPIESLKRFLQNKQILLALDNFEHLLAAASLPAKLLKASPHLKILATSRESLQLSGEHVYAVPPLELESSVELFQQRARRVKRDIEFDDTNLETIKRITARLDGLPLAIELAAARVVMLSPQALLPHLGNRLDLLKGTVRDAPERHQTLRATLDWSYELLDPDEKTLFNRLGVFAGGCSLEAVDVVCSKGLSIYLFEGLESLLKKSLLWQEEDLEGESRFIMLETVREYALEQLVANDEVEATRKWHAKFFASLAEQAEPEFLTHSLVTPLWVDRIEQELDNLRSAFNWSMAGDVLPGLQIVTALKYFWYSRHTKQGRKLVEQALERADDAPLFLRNKVLGTAGLLAVMTGDWEIGRELEADALAVCRQLDDPHALAWALTRLGTTDLNMGNYSPAKPLLLEGLALFREIDDRSGASHALNALGEMMRIQEYYEDAKTYYEESLSMRLDSGQDEGSSSLFNLATVYKHLGDDEKAYKLYMEALVFSRRVGYESLSILTLVGLAGVYSEKGQPERAARLLGAAEATRESIGFTIQPVDLSDFDRSIADTRALLDEASFEAAWAEGRSITLEEAIELALK